MYQSPDLFISFTDKEMKASARPPSQEDVDRVAEYCRVVDELSKQPFLGPDANQDTLIHQGGKCWAVLGDRRNFDSALIHFRKLWMNDEYCSFERVRNIVLRYKETSPSNWVWLPIEKRAFQAFLKRKFYEEYIPQTIKESIDLWINGKFAHIGSDKRNGKTIQEHLLDLELGYGASVVEFYARFSVRMISETYINFFKFMAAPELDRYHDIYSLSPTIPYPQRHEKVLYEKSFIETEIQTLSRLLKRDRYSNLRKLLARLFSIHQNEFLELVINDFPLTELVQASGRSIVENLPVGIESEAESTFLDTYCHPYRRGGYRECNSFLAFTEEGEAILSAQLEELRIAYRKERSQSHI